MIRLHCCNVQCQLSVFGSGIFLDLVEIIIRKKCMYFFGISFGVYDYNCFSFVGLDNYRFLHYMFLIQLLYIIQLSHLCGLRRFSEFNKGFEVKYT